MNRFAHYFFTFLFLVSILLNFIFIFPHFFLNKIQTTSNDDLLQNEAELGSSELGFYEPEVYFSYLNKSKSVYPVKDTNQPNSLPQKIVINSGDYVFLRKMYSLKEEGLYRFLNQGKNQAQRIVYKNNTLALLSGLAWMISHGHQHDYLPIKQLKILALDKKLSLSCSPAVAFTQSILNDLKIQNRLVWTLTREKTNSYNNGHTLLEVYDTQLKKWVVYDLDNNLYFLSLKGNRPLSFLELVQSLENKDSLVKFEPISSDISIDIDNEYVFFEEHTQANSSNLAQWFNRVVQTPLIRESHKNYFYEKNPNLTISQHNIYLKKQQFLTKFYP